MNLNLEDRTALITGGSKGIGFACAMSLAREGCNLRLAARTESDLAAFLAPDLSAFTTGTIVTVDGGAAAR